MDTARAAHPTLYLASTSPRRRRLLEAAGLPFELARPGDEPRDVPGVPARIAVGRARAKAVDARIEVPSASPHLVLGADTVVELAGREYGKPADADEARAFLRALAGREHDVHSALVLERRAADGSVLGRDERIDSATVRLDGLDEQRIETLVRGGVWRGKAGGYGIQDAEFGPHAVLVAGAFDTVVGLHIAGLQAMIRAAAAR